MGITFKQKWVRKYWTFTIMEHMETKDIHNYVIDLTSIKSKTNTMNKV